MILASIEGGGRGEVVAWIRTGSGDLPALLLLVSFEAVVAWIRMG